MPKKLTYEFIRSEFEKGNYQLLTKKYRNAHQKLNYICPEGHKHFITWHDWQKGHRCPYCVGKAKPTIEFIKKEFENENYILLSDEYGNNYTKLDYVCPQQHKHSITWNNWQQGHKCPYCVGLGKPTTESIRSEFEKENYILLSDKYENSYTKLDYICPEKHKHSIRWNDWQQGYRCPYCSGNVKLTIEFIREEFEKENYKLLTNKYKNTRQKLKYVCPNNHKHLITWGSWQQGQRCPTCYRLNCFGKNNPAWKGGISCEPYCFEWSSKEFKNFIKERDGNRCLNPACFGNIHRLSVHHIDYNKKNCEPENLITLCVSCNSRANKDREWHTDWYKAIMIKRYGY